MFQCPSVAQECFCNRSQRLWRLELIETALSPWKPTANRWAGARERANTLAPTPKLYFAEAPYNRVSSFFQLCPACKIIAIGNIGCITGTLVYYVDTAIRTDPNGSWEEERSSSTEKAGPYPEGNISIQHYVLARLLSMEMSVLSCSLIPHYKSR